MALTPEQFNQLAMKQDLRNLKHEILEEINEKLDAILTSVDNIAKSGKDSQEEKIANIAAHDRFEERLVKIEKHLEFKPLVN